MHAGKWKPQLTNAFSSDIVEAKPPNKFKIPRLDSYMKKIDLMDHIAYFEYFDSLLDLYDALQC